MRREERGGGRRHLGLLVHGWVPVGVIENDSICPSQVDAYSSTSGAQNEEKNFGGGVELLHEDLPLFWLSGPIQSKDESLIHLVSQV